VRAGRFNPEATSSKTITFSSLTTPQIFQMSIEVRRLPSVAARRLEP
jgi:hypothetical protein